jgi:hypothetical protein
VSQDERPVIGVTAITHRKNYIFQDVHAGYTEHKLMGAVPREAALIKAVCQTVPTVKNVCMPVSGNCRFHAYISIAKRTPGQAKNAICAAFAADMLLKHVVIVDEDIDVFDEEQVLWAVSNRFQADKDLVVIANAQGSELDPPLKSWWRQCQDGPSTLLVDGGFTRAEGSRRRMRRIRLEDFLPNWPSEYPMRSLTTIRKKCINRSKQRSPIVLREETEMKHKEVWLAAWLWLLPNMVMAEDVIQIDRSDHDAAIIALKPKAFAKGKYPDSDQHRHRLPYPAAKSHQRQIPSHYQ